MNRVALVLAAGLAAAIYLPPWVAILGEFPAHMLRHMALVAGVAPLLVLAAPALAWRAGIPVMLGAALEFIVVWAWHLPLLHGAAQTSLSGFLLEQVVFLAAGLAVWAGALAAREPLAGAGGLFVTSMHMTLLGALLILAPNDLYAEVCGRAPSLSGQQLGGMLMLAIGTPIYLLAGLILSARALRIEAGR